MTKLNIPRLPEESDEEFRRRYNRECMRAWRARQPKRPRKAVVETRPRKNSPFTAEEWADLRRRPDETADEHRKRNQRARDRVFSERHPGAKAARSRKVYAQDPRVGRERAARFRAENPETVKAQQKRYLEAHPERMETLKSWRRDNPDRLRAAVKAWSAENRALLNAYSAAWRRQARIATPAWSDFEQVKVFYEEAQRLTAETGIVHHVDHIVPLRGRNVCGLHTQRNLRVIPGPDNVRKQATMDLILIDGLWQAERGLFPLPDADV